MSAYSQLVLADRPVGYWRLNETSGTTAADSSGNGLNGTYQTGVTLNQAGLLLDDTSGSLLTDASGEGVILADTALHVPLPVATLEAWITPLAFGNTNYSCFIMSGHTGSYNLRFDSGGTLIYTEVGIANYSTGWTPTVGATYHVVGIIDTNANTFALWVNGSLFSTTSIGDYYYGSGSNGVGLGRDPTYAPSFFNGRSQDYAIYDRALPGDRIIAHYTEGRVKGFVDEASASGPRFWLPFNEPAGSTAIVDRVSGKRVTVNGAVTLGASDGVAGDTDTASSWPNATSAYLNPSVSSLGVAPFSVEAWVKTGSTAEQWVISRRDGTSVGWQFTFYNNTFYLYNTVGGLGQAYSFPADGNWHHVVGAADNSNIWQYVDGALVGTRAQTWATVADSVGIYVGKNARDNGAPWNGQMQHLLEYPKVLSASEVRRHYAARLIPPLRGRTFA